MPSDSRHLRKSRLLVQPREWTFRNPLEVVRTNLLRRIYRRKGLKATDLKRDEFGVPQEWRHEVVSSTLLEASSKDWPVFEKWAVGRGLNPFPPSPETVLRFLCENWDRGELLYRTWRAIELRSDAYYWHSNASPVFLLRVYRGLDVEPDGTIVLLSSDNGAE
ncbi:MAG: hypothetical protein ACRDK3_08730 [Actinomycetota bacterium]